MRELREIGRALIAAVAVAGATLLSIVGLPVALLVGVCLYFASFIRPSCVRFKVGRLRYRVHRGLTGSLVADQIPDGPLDERGLRFTTTEGRRFIPTHAQPVGIRFEQPVTQEVVGVPSSVKMCGQTILRVDEFCADGIVLGDQLPGVEIVAEVSYAA